jgi:hypothetical protein
VGTVDNRQLQLPAHVGERYIPPKRRLTQYLHYATSQKTAFFIVTAVNTSNLTTNKNFMTSENNCGRHIATNAVGEELPTQNELFGKVINEILLILKQSLYLKQKINEIRNSG